MQRASSLGSRVEYITAQSLFDDVEFADHDGEPPVCVVSVAPDSDAFRKGVRDGDVVVSLNGQDTRRKRYQDVSSLLQDRRTQKIVGFERQSVVSIGQDDSDAEGAKYRAALEEAVNPVHVYFPSSEPVGIIFEGGDTFDKKTNQFTSVLIGDFEESSAAPSKGLRVGDVLIAVNERSVEGSSLNEVVTAIWACRAQETLHLTFDRIVPVFPPSNAGSVAIMDKETKSHGEFDGSSSSGSVVAAEFKSRDSASYAIKIVEDDNLDDFILVGGKEVYPNAVQYTPIRVASIAFGSSLRSRGFCEGDILIAISGVSVQNRSMAYVLRRLRSLWTSQDPERLSPSHTILVDRPQVAPKTNRVAPGERDLQSEVASAKIRRADAALPRNLRQISQMLNESTDAAEVVQNLKLASMAILDRLQESGSEGSGLHVPAAASDAGDSFNMQQYGGIPDAGTWMRKLEMTMTRQQRSTQQMFLDLMREVEDLKRENAELRAAQSRGSSRHNSPDFTRRRKSSGTQANDRMRKLVDDQVHRRYGCSSPSQTREDAVMQGLVASHRDEVEKSHSVVGNGRCADAHDSRGGSRSVESGGSRTPPQRGPAMPNSDSGVGSEVALAKQWTEHVDPISHRTFWHNSLTNTCTWKRPLSVEEQCEWIQQQSRAFGKPFWYNRVSGATTWERPEDYSDPPPSHVYGDNGARAPRTPNPPPAESHRVNSQSQAKPTRLFSPATLHRHGPHSTRPQNSLNESAPSRQHKTVATHVARREQWGFSPTLESPKKSSHVRDVLP